MSKSNLSTVWILSLAALALATAAPALAGKQVTLRIEGMDCPPCAKAVKRKLEAVPGVASATVDHASGKADVALKDDAKVSADAMKAAVEAAGYVLKGAEGI